MQIFQDVSFSSVLDTFKVLFSNKLFIIIYRIIWANFVEVWGTRFAYASQVYLLDADENSRKGNCDTTKKAISILQSLSTQQNFKTHQNLTSYSLLSHGCQDPVIDHARKHVTRLTPVVRLQRPPIRCVSSAPISCSNAWRFKCDQRRYLPCFWTLLRSIPTSRPHEGPRIWERCQRHFPRDPNASFY